MKGGIGGAPVDEVETAPEPELIPGSERPSAAVLLARIDKDRGELVTEMHDLHIAANETRDRLNQLQAQLSQVEIPQIVQAINQLNARCEALAQRMFVNIRVTALEAVVKCRQPGEHASAMVKTAEAFAAFLSGPLPEPQLPGEARITDIPPDEPPHRH